MAKEDVLEVIASTTKKVVDLRANAAESTYEIAPEGHESQLWTFRHWSRAYGSTLVGMIFIVHIIASLVTVTLYFARPLTFLPFSDSRLYAPIYGLLFTYVVCLLIAVVCFSIASVERANSRSYGLIRIRLTQLRALLCGLGLLESQAPLVAKNIEEQLVIESGAKQGHQVIACREARDCYLHATQHIERHRTGLEWLLGTGYINLWGTIHEAEEALIEVEPPEIVIRGAMHDKLAIQNSTIGNREELLDKLIRAVSDLNPAEGLYFREQQPDKISEDILKLQQHVARDHEFLRKLAESVHKLDNTVNVDPQDLDVESPVTDEEKAAAATRARIALREVRSTLNEFRDSLWEGLVRARNQLLYTMGVTGLVTHILLCIAIVMSGPNQPALMAATIFYMVGAIAGLFGRFYNESSNSTAVDDYGLALARLIATPLLSGLAGIGGVLITAILYSTLLMPSLGSNPHPALFSITLSSVFRPDEPSYLLTAAVFGLAPNLIISGLRQRTAKYASDLQSSKSTS